MNEAARNEVTEQGTQAAWRAACRAAARAQSEEEARRAWSLAPEDPIPFDHRWEHVTQVVALALRVGRAVGADLETVEAAAWLHDVRKEEPSHGIAGAAAAATILAATDFPPQKIPAVCDAIRQHVGLFRAEGAPPLTPVEAAVLWDADKLSKLGVQAVIASVCSVYAAGRSMDERWRFVAEFLDAVLSRTVASMNTRPARRMAERRYRNMLALVSLWAREARETGSALHLESLFDGGDIESADGETDLEISSDYAGLSKE